VRIDACASSRPACLNQRITRRRTSSVTAVRSAAVIGRDGMNTEVAAMMTAAPE
jgi:hypothetical protein